MAGCIAHKVIFKFSFYLLRKKIASENHCRQIYIKLSFLIILKIYIIMWFFSHIPLSVTQSWCKYDFIHPLKNVSTGH